jgi:hypothetical protein
MCGGDSKLLAIAFANLLAATAAVSYLLLSRGSDTLTLASAAVLLNAFPVMLLIQR